MTVQHRTTVTGWGWPCSRSQWHRRRLELRRRALQVTSLATGPVRSSAIGTTSPAPNRSGTRSGSPGSWPLCTPRNTTPSTAQPRYQTYVSTLHNPHADAEAAAAAAAHEVLVAFFPANQLTLDGQLAESLSTVPDGHAEDAGVVIGRAVADLILDARADDGYSTVDPFNPTPGPGVWEPTPPAFAPMLEAQFHNVTPFTLRDRAQFLPDPPPSLTSERYARHSNEVKVLGQHTSTVRTPDQTHLAHFWAEPSPSGWSRIGNLVSARYGYDLHDTARLQALLNMAMADGFIVGWYQKRLFAFWRPDDEGDEADDQSPASQDYREAFAIFRARAWDTTLCPEWENDVLTDELIGNVYPGLETGVVHAMLDSRCWMGGYHFVFRD